MPEPTDPNQNSGSLDGRVGTLLQEALDAAERVETGLGSKGTVAGANESTGTVAASGIVGASTEPKAADGVHSEPSDIGQLDDDLAMLTESLISSETISPGSETTTTKAAVSPPLPSPPTTGTDATQSPAAPLPAASKTEPAPPGSPLASTTSDPPTAAATGTGKTETAKEHSGTASAAAPGTAPSLSSPPAQAAPSTVAGIAPAKRGASIAKVAAGTAPIALAGLSVVSKPLLSRPRIVRDTVGWLALWTLFLAGCVWVYILFVHKPSPPESNGDAIHLVTADRVPAEAPKAQAHAPDAHGTSAAHDKDKAATGEHH